MHAYKLTVTVPASGHVELDLPADFRGAEAEVIVLHERTAPAVVVERLSTSPDEPAHTSNADALLALSKEWSKAPLPARTREEVDREIEEQRNSWGDDP